MPPSANITETMQTLARRLFPLALWACLLAGCSGHPHGVLEPVMASAPGASEVDMLVATTRSPDAKPGIMFGGLRGPALSFADIVVSLPPDGVRKIGEVQWPAHLPGDPSHDFVTRRAKVIDFQTALALGHERIRHTPKRQVFVFVHGFNNKFEDAVYRFAQIVHDSGTQAMPVLFTWPSKGSVLAYGYDRESSTYSRDALEKVLKGIASDPDVGEVSVMAHSMGNWLLLESLRQMAIRDGRIAPKIRNVLLAAPDVDIDVARQQIADMGPAKPAFALFLSRNDRALAVSKDLWGSTDRLGALDPLKPANRAMLERERIAVYDLSDLSGSTPLNHDTFATSPEIVRVIGGRLAAGQTVEGSQQRFSDAIFSGASGAVSRVGDAAGLVASAPTAAIDADARDTYAERFGAFGHSLFGR